MSVSRVRYRERQILRREDLNDEQEYRLEQQRRHNIAHHGWGVVTGLALSGGGWLEIEPGVAVDGYGRTLVLPHFVEVSDEVLARCLQSQEGEIDVWLFYARRPETSSPNGRQPDRWREEARVRLTVANSVNPRRPEAIAAADRDFGPHRPPPDDPAREWPIYLGRLRRTEDVVQILPAHRPAATLFGAAVDAPSGRARLQIENELAGARRVFAMSTADDAGQWQDRLVIDRRGQTAVYGKLSLRPLKPELNLKGRLNFDALDASPKAAKPWQIYYTAVSPDETTTLHQLRFEIAHPGQAGDPKRYKVAIGHSPGLDKFSSRFMVRADGSVIVNGSIKLEGELIEGPISADPNDPRFANALMNNWLGGISSAAGTIDAHYSNPMEMTITSIPESVPSGGNITYTLSIRNSGRAELRNLTITEIMSVPAQAPRQTNVELEEDTLAANGSMSVTHASPVPIVPGGGTMTLLVTAVAVGPDGGQVQSTVTEEIQVSSPGVF